MLYPPQTLVDQVMCVNFAIIEGGLSLYLCHKYVNRWVNMVILIHFDCDYVIISIYFDCEHCNFDCDYVIISIVNQRGLSKVILYYQ